MTVLEPTVFKKAFLRRHYKTDATDIFSCLIVIIIIINEMVFFYIYKITLNEIYCLTTGPWRNVYQSALVEP